VARAAEATTQTDGGGGEPDDVMRAVYELGGKVMGCGVSLEEIGEELVLSKDKVGRLSDGLVEEGALEWCTLGHLALTHVGLERAKHWEPNPSGRA
jgi:hypothetical protein